MQTTPLHADFGVEIHGIDLTEATSDNLYPQIREAFEQHSLLLFRGQNWTDDDILKFGRLFGPIENRGDGPDHVSKVSNLQADGSVLLPDAIKLKDLKGNMLWHTDSTFLPVPSLANIITGRIVPSSGGATELVSTRSGYRRLPEHLRKAAKNAVMLHRLSHSRSKIDPELAQAAHITKWEGSWWRAIWPNPVSGDEAVYIASHACEIDGMESGPARALIDEIVAHLTTANAIYAHKWQVGDVLIWDERATLHRGMPWPYEEPRELASICVTARAEDGLDAVKVA
ncbi:MAG: TauD/TfdA dioxygenase family protein [Paracoccaceae bacterium]